VASLAGIVAQGAIASGGSLADGLRPAVVGDVLGTRFGTAWGLRLADLAVLAVLLRVPLPRNPVALGAIGLGLGFLTVVPALAGHPGVTDPRAISLAASVVHVGAFSLWAGGLAALLAAVPAATRELEGAEKTRLLARVVAGFSGLALWSVAALLASGVVQAILQLESWGELIDTGYGRAILVKAALLFALIGLGAVNRGRIRPRLMRLAREGAVSTGGTGRALRRTLAAEAALIAAVLVATAVLTALSPAAATQGPFSGSAELGPAELELTVDPSVVGANEAHIYLFDRQTGAQYDDVKELGVDASLPASDIGPLEQAVRKSGPGHYVIRDLQLGPAGSWRLEVAARVSAFDQYEAEIEVPVR
jgi:copper transport protein